MTKSVTINRRTELAANVWESIGRPWLLGTAGGAILLLYLVSLVIQQMPGQLHDDPAGATRWILVTSEAYGPWGGVLRTLGLFTILHNPLLQLLLLVIALVLCIQMGNTLATARRLYQLNKGLTHLTVDDAEHGRARAGEPVLLPTTQPIYRMRVASTGDHTTLPDTFAIHLGDRFDTVRRTTQTVNAMPSSTAEGEEMGDGSGPKASEPEARREQVTETRLLALRHIRPALLRPILFMGLFVALLAVWFTLVWGWEVSSPPLAPGAEYRSSNHELLLRYTLTSPQAESPKSVIQEDTTEGESQEQQRPQLVTRIAEEEAATAIGTSVRLNRGQTYVANQLGPPALFMRTVTEAAMLSRLGQTQMVPSMGLVFPSPGSEEAVVLDQALGLRIVRMSTNEPIEPDQFLVEVYDVTANEIIDRIPVQQATSAELTVNGMPVTVEFTPLPSLIVTVIHQPRIWLLWPALALVLVGLVGYAYAPTFVLVQVAPWPVDRAVIVAQSDVKEEIRDVEQLIHGQDIMLTSSKTG